MNTQRDAVVEEPILTVEDFVTGKQHDVFRDLRRTDPVHWHVDEDGQGQWSVTRHADVTEVSRQPDVFSSQRGGVSRVDLVMAEQGVDPRGVMMMMTDPPQHTRYRRLVNRGFTPRTMRLLEEELHGRTVSIVDRVAEMGECDLVPDVAAELPLQAIAEIMGMPQEERAQLFDWSERIRKLEDPTHPNEDSMQAAFELFGYAHALGVDRRAEPKDDILSILARAEVEGDDGQPTSLTEAEFDAFALLLVVAGNETTRNAISAGVLELLRRPDQWDLLCGNAGDDNWLDIAADEILRFTSPSQHMYRTAVGDYELAGKQIKEGERVVMWYASANRDEEVYDHPMELDLTRHPNPHVAFGAGGPHYCLGAHLARMELRLMIGELARRFPAMTLDGEPEPLRSNFVAGLESLPVRLT